MNKSPVALWALCCVGLILAWQLNHWYWPGALFHNETASIWACLAWDLAQGEFYRPLLSPEGYGGTRYMPLYFALQAALIGLGLDVQLSAICLFQGSVLLCVLASLACLRSLATPWSLALPVSLSLYASILYQDTSLAPRCDYLAAGLVLAALAARRSWPGAALMLWLAFLCKLTSLYLLPLLVGWLVHQGRKRAAVALLLSTLLACGLSVWVLEALSQGRFSENFWATLDGGGIHLDFLLALPQRWWRNLTFDPFLLALLLPLAGVAWKERGLQSLYWLSAWAITLFLYTSPGTDYNHCIELQIASLPLLALALQRPSRFWTSWLSLLTLGWILTAWIWGRPSLKASVETYGKPTLAAAHSVWEDYLRDCPRPWFSTNPILALVHGEKPFLLDSFNLRHMVARNTAVGRDFRQKIEDHGFSVVILWRKYIHLPYDVPPGDPRLALWEEAIWATQYELKVLRPSYQLHEIRRPFLILLPTPGTGMPAEKQSR